MTQRSDSDSELVSESIFARWRDTPVPEHTVGNCVRWEKCKSFNIDLGNGYCVKCWDKGYG